MRCQYVEGIFQMAVEPFVIVVQEGNELAAACRNSSLSRRRCTHTAFSVDNTNSRVRKAIECGPAVVDHQDFGDQGTLLNSGLYGALQRGTAHRRNHDGDHDWHLVR